MIKTLYTLEMPCNGLSLRIRPMLSPRDSHTSDTLSRRRGMDV